MDFIFKTTEESGVIFAKTQGANYNNSSWKFHLNDGSVRIGNYEQYWDDYYQSTITVNDGIWHHISVMQNGNELELYIDGQFDGSISHSTPNQTSTEVGIAAQRGSSSWYDYGSIVVDNIQVWNEYNYGGEIIVDYRFSEGEGNILYDYSGNENHGTIYGATWNIIGGCTDTNACNYDSNAAEDDGSCEYVIDCTGGCGGSAYINDCDGCVSDTPAYIDINICECGSGGYHNEGIMLITSAGFVECYYHGEGLSLNNVSDLSNCDIDQKSKHNHF